ncbi:MAG: MogA/MoaB family molybdenum cofactor biosynthesis protein [Candidatus Ranarchaeia archaeon]
MVDIPSEHKKKSPASIRFYLFIISTSLSEADNNYSLDSPPPADKTTPLVRSIIEKARYRLIGMSLVSDQKIRIQTELAKTYQKYNPDIILFSGGTGISPRDITPEAIIPLLDKQLSGFETLFHQLSFQEIGPATILSRATAGTYKTSLVFSLPGSPNAVQLALEKIIIPEAGHLLAMLRSNRK